MKVSWRLAPALVGALVGGVTNPTVTPEGGADSARSPQVSVEAALEHGDLLTAFRTTEAAHRRAIRDRRWESLIDVGDAYYRIAGQTGAPHVARQRAHDAYEAALHGARRAESLDGVLRAAESFAQLGDVEEVELSLHVARDLAGSDSEAVDDVQAAAGRLSDLLEAARTDERGDFQRPGRRRAAIKLVTLLSHSR
jgi:hypothetical protein